MNLLKSLSKSQLWRFGSSLVCRFGSSQQRSHVVGLPYERPIDVSTGLFFRRMVEKHHNKIAVHSYDQNCSLTYEDLWKKALALACALCKQFNLKPNDRIGVYSFNKWEWYVVQLAASLANLILVNINPSYQSDELAYTLNKVRLKVLFISDSFKSSNYLKILRETVPQLNSPKVNSHRINSKEFQFLQAIVRFNPSEQQHFQGFLNFTELLHAPISSKNLPDQFADAHDPANIQFTSGTTGRPKAATLTHFNILNNGFVIGNRCGYSQSDNICIPVPLYHCFGMIMGNLAALTRGAQLTYVCEGFDPLKAIEAVTKYKCTSLYGVPTMFSEYLRIYEANPEKYDISYLRTGIIAGSLAPSNLMEKIINTLGIKQITNCYGMTETSPVTFQTRPGDTFEQKTTTVGSILEGLQAKLVNEKGEICPIGTPGEFVLKGWAVMKEYWEDQVETQKALGDGWMKSGDIGVLDQDGFLTIVGRSKDMIIRGGENVYPKEIEEFLNKKSAHILDTQVVAVSDQKFGEQIAAVIRVKSLENNQVKKDDIFTWCKGHIAHYKIPKYVKFVTEYPLTVTGKIQKFVIREQLQEQKINKGLSEYAIR